MSSHPTPLGPSALTAVPVLMLLVPLPIWSESPGTPPADIQRLVRQLGDESFNVRQEASHKLQKIGLNALPYLEDATDNNDPEVCTRAWELIDHWAAGGKIPALLYQLSRGTAPVRAGAAESLGKMEAKGQPALPGLIQATGDSAEYVRCSAQEAVKKIQATLAVRLEVKPQTETIEVDTPTVFRIEVSNQGQTSATEVRFTAVVPEALTILAVEGPIAHKRQGNKIVSETMVLEANESRCCEIQVKAAGPGQARVQVELSAEGLNAPVIGEASTTVTPPVPMGK
jgi:uncharacterized repeat protein (TIGR01451 family)